MTIRRQLIRLVAATVIPAALCASLLIVYAHDRQSALVEDRTLDVARAMAQTVDRELARYQAGMQALATSPHLASGDFAAFHHQVRHALRDLQGDLSILTDASGRQLVNTERAFGEPLAPRSSLTQVSRVFETGKPVISDLFVDEAARRSLVAIDVPVRLDDRVAYALAIAVFPERLGDVLKYQVTPSDWVVAIFDSRGTIVARNRDAERFIGRKGPRALVERMAEVDEGLLETNTLEGTPVVAAFSHSTMSHWSVAIGIPRSSVNRDLWMPIGWIIGGALLLFAGGIAMAQRVGARISRSIYGLIPPAVALGHGDPVVVPPLQLREADEVGRELLNASERLHDRERTLALVTHDLRSPLNAIMMRAAAIETLAQQTPGAERIGILAASHLDLARRMSGMVDDLLAIAVGTSGGRSMLTLAPVGAASLLERAADAARPLFAQQGIALKIQALGELPEIRVDSDRVLRVFANLLDNALKFTERQGCVVVQAKVESEQVRICISNSGRALSAVELECMFKPFWQAGRGDRRGAGLGMSICRSIVEAHGGRIWAEPEQGMRVRICFSLPFGAVNSPAGGA